MRPTLGLVTIGQAPRPDLLPDIRHLLGEIVPVERGALDGLDRTAIDALAPGPAEPVLTSRLADGHAVTLTAARLEPLLAAAVRDCADAGAAAVLILCTGDLAEIEAPVPVLHAETLAHAATVAIVANGNLGIVSPMVEQTAAAATRWADRLGRPVLVDHANPYTGTAAEVGAAADRLAARGADWVLLDCLGYTEEMRTAAGSGVPVLLARSLCVRLAVEAVLALAPAGD